VPRIGTVGMPGARTVGPVGERVITPEKVAAMSALAEAAREAAMTPPAEPPPIPEEKKEEPPDALGKELEQDGLYEEIESRMRQNIPGGHDLELVGTLAFMDSKRRRKAVEARIKQALNFSDYVMRGEYRQEVPIWGDDMPIAEFRSHTAEDHLAIRHFVAGGEYGGNPLVADAAQTFLIVACGLVRIGEDALPDIPKKIHGEARRLIIKQRMDWLLEKPYDLVQDLYNNYLWFQARIRLAQYRKDGPFRRVDQE